MRNKVAFVVVGILFGWLIGTGAALVLDLAVPLLGVEWEIETSRTVLGLVILGGIITGGVLGARRADRPPKPATQTAVAPGSSDGPAPPRPEEEVPLRRSRDPSMTPGRIVQWVVVFPMLLAMEAIAVIVALDWFVEGDGPQLWVALTFAALGTLATMTTVVALLWDNRGPENDRVRAAELDRSREV